MNDQWRNIALETRAVDLGAETIGSLRFRGGLALSSSDPDFGGVSGLEALEDGRLIAVTDAGKWVEAHVRLDQQGALIGLDEARIALLRDESGAPFASKEAGDAEGLAQLPDGRFAVSFEQTHTIRLYDLNRDGPFGAAAPGPTLGDTDDLPNNAGLEALAADAEGRLLVGAEQEGLLWLAPLQAAAPTPPISRYPLDFGYALVSLDRLPDGDFIALERFYAPVIGARIRVTRLSAESLGSANGGARKTELGFLAPPLVLDNFEGAAVTRLPNGEVRLYIVSDDNFSAQQRTLLFAFDLVVSE